MFGVQKLTTHQKQRVLGSALFWVWVVNFWPFRARMIKVNYLVTTISAMRLSNMLNVMLYMPVRA